MVKRLTEEFVRRKPQIDTVTCIRELYHCALSYCVDLFQNRDRRRIKMLISKVLTESNCNVPDTIILKFVSGFAGPTMPSAKRETAKHASAVKAS